MEKPEEVSITMSSSVAESRCICFFRSYWQEEGVTVHVYMQDEKSRQAQSVNLSGLVISRPCEK